MLHRLCTVWLVVIAACAALALAPASNAQQQVDIALEQFGVQSAYRPGDFTGIQMRLTSNLDEPQNVQVVWEVPEALGDIQEITRSNIALTPGLPISIWLYAKLLPTVDNSTVYTVRVFEDDDGDRGTELGAIRIDPRMVPGGAKYIPPTNAIVGIVGGTGDVGFLQYDVRDPDNRFPLTGHEFVEVAVGIPPVALPDRWEGYDSFEAIVWTDAQPGSIRDQQARAIREWVKRGGHFIIILQQAGNDWQLGSSPITALHDLLPQSNPQVSDSTSLELLPVLSKRRGNLPANANVPFPIRIFETIDNGYEPIIALPDNRVVAIERRVGFGRITVIGIDISSRQLTSLVTDGGGMAFEAEMVWNIILGKRQDTLTPQQVARLANPPGPGNPDPRLYTGNRNPIDLGSGKLILEQIALSGQAFAGIGLAFLLFIAYWLLAGPLGFAFLKGAKKVQHAWLAFALMGIVFTVVAWLGVKVFSQNSTQVRHVTFLDFIAENPGSASGQAQAADALPTTAARATSWCTIFLPGYRKPLLAVNGDNALERNLLVPFAAPGEDITAFTNIDRYTIDVDDPEAYRVPARSTTKELYARYVGDPTDEWGSIEVSEPITLDAAGNIVSGKIIHSFPSALENARVIIVKPGRLLAKEYIDETGSTGQIRAGTHGQMVIESRIVSPSRGRIEPLSDFSLVGAIGQNDRFARYIDDRYRSAKSQVAGVGGGGSVGASARDYMFMLSFYNMITPPEYQNANVGWDNTRDRPAQVHRHLGRELDLSEWLTRPCIIIYGEIEDTSADTLGMPYPLTVDGDAVQQVQGRVVVRFIHPLPMTVEDAKPAQRVDG